MTMLFKIGKFHHKKNLAFNLRQDLYRAYVSRNPLLLCIEDFGLLMGIADITDSLN